MRRVALLAAAFLWSFVVTTMPSRGAEVTFAGQKISLIIGYGVGGGYDLYGRMVARFLGKYLPGHPVVVPQNMVGAGSLVAANYIYNIAPKDGTTLGVIDQTIPPDQLMDPSHTTFDSAKFNWIGRMASGVETITVWHTSPVQSIDQAKTTVATIAATGPSSGSAIFPTVLNNLIGTKFKVVTGYAGSKEMLLAMERGEDNGCGAIDGSTLTSQFSQWLTDKTVKVLTQISLKRDPAFPDVPTFVELGQNDHQKQILKLFAVSGDIGRALLAPPGVPADRVAVLRKAFMETMRDPELLAYAKKNKIEISPMEGSVLQKLVVDLNNTPQAIVKEAAAAKTLTK